MCSLKLILCCQQRSRDCPPQKLLAEARLYVLWMLRNQPCRRRWPPRSCNTISSTELRFRKRSYRSFESSAGSSALFRPDRLPAPKNVEGIGTASNGHPSGHCSRSEGFARLNAKQGEEVRSTWLECGLSASTATD